MSQISPKSSKSPKTTTLLSKEFAKTVIRSDDYENASLIEKINQAVKICSQGEITNLFIEKGPLTIDMIDEYIKNHYEYLNNVCKNEIPDFKDLMERKTFVLNGKLHNKVILVAKLGIGRHLYTKAAHFKEHLNDLINQYYSNISRICEKEITNYKYLMSHEWFMSNKSYHTKLITIVKNGKGKEVNVFADDFDDHLDKIIATFTSTKTT